MNQIWVWLSHIHTYWKLFWLLKANQMTTRLKFGIWSPSDWVKINNAYECSSGCGLVLEKPTGSCFGCQKLIKGPARPKFEWLP